MAVPYKLNYFEIESGLGTTSTFLHKGDLTANRIIKIGGTSNDILLGDGSTGSLSGKQNAITLTTSGTSGAATLIGATLNIPQYTDQFVGTVTSVGLTSSTSGVTISSSPITTSGNIVLSIATASGSQNGLLSSADWATFNNKTSNLGTVTSVAALTLGTTGTDLSSTVANGTTTPVITLNVPTASATNRGALSSTDWSTFNAKQPAGNYITSLTGEATASGPGAASVTLDNTAVIGKVLTGLNITGGTVVSTDSILTALGKVQNQINGLIGGSIFQGTWDANTNTPALTSSVGTNGHYYIVSVAGTTNLNGITDWKVGDWAIFAGTTWQKVDNTDAVASVNGYTGTVSLVTGDVLEGAGSLPSRPSQLYFTDARARAAISLTTSGTSGAATYDNGTGVLNIPNYLQDLSGYVTLNTAQTITAAKTFTTSGGSDTLIINHSSGSGIGLSITKGGNGEGLYINKTSGTGNAATIIGTLNATTLVKSGGTSSQFLKADGSVDSTSYQPLLSDPVTGIGVTNYVPKFSALSLIGISQIYDNGTNVGINTSSPSFKLDVNGTGRFTSQLTLGSTITNGTYTYTLPSATGTLALTSALSAYLPLSGGTLTGALFGTTASFASSIGLTSASSSSSLTSTTNGIEISVDGSTTSNKNTIFKVGSSETMRIDANGNLGLGVTPSAWGVVGPVLQINRASFYGYINQARVGANNYFDGSSFKYIDSDFASQYTQNSGQHAWYNAPSGTAGNPISFTQAMTLDASGRLGIGTTSPVTNLEVSARDAILRISDVKSASAIGEVSSALQFWSSDPSVASGSNASRVRASINTIFDSATGSLNSLTFNVNDGTASGLPERMRITSSGNVGIGTDNPTFHLDVRGTTPQTLRLSRSGTAGSGGAASLIFEAREPTLGTGQTAGISSNLGVLAFNTGGVSGDIVGGTQRMAITSAGNVGIGTTSPGAKLHTSTTTAGNSIGVLLANPNQSGSADSVSINFGLGRTADSFLRSDAIITYGKEQQWTGTPSTVDGYLSFATTLNETTSERMRITSTGNVGIGTTSPNVSGIEISRNTGSVSPIPAELRISTSTNPPTADWSSTLPWGRLSFYSNDASVGGAKIHAALDVISTGSTGGLSDLVFSLAQPSTGALVERMRLVAGGNLCINTTSATSRLQVVGLPSYADNAAAITGGLTVGAFYHTAGALKVVI
jgi:hypothetical protein